MLDESVSVEDDPEEAADVDDDHGQQEEGALLLHAHSYVNNAI